MNRKLKVAILAIMLAGGLRAAVTLQLDPMNGSATGAPGDTVGWGFTLTNTDVDYLAVTGSNFDVGCQGCPGPSATIGSYADFIGGPFYVLGPGEGTTLTQSFDDGMQTGVGAFAISNSAPGGTVLNGYIEVDYETFSCDPLTSANPDACLLTPDAQLYQAAAVNVSPEPGWLGFFGLGVLVSFGVMTGRKAQGRPTVAHVSCCFPKGAMADWTWNEREDRRPARHVGPDGAEDSRCARALAWIWDRAAH